MVHSSVLQKKNKKNKKIKKTHTHTHLMNIRPMRHSKAFGKE
jgi:hypothetical protein